MAHPFDVFKTAVFNGQLLLTPCPATKGTDLATSVNTLKQAGASGIITLMADTELAQNGAARLGEVSRDLGLQWYQLPISDNAAPSIDFQQAWNLYSTDILRRLNAGETLAIHCKGGSGRTGLIASQIMLAAGAELSETIAAIQAIRPRALQQTEHLTYLNQIATIQESIA